MNLAGIGMSFADSVAIILSLLALWVAALAYWRTFAVWVTITEVNGGAVCSIHENNGEMFQQYSVTLKNLGIPIHEMSVLLRFDEVDTQRSVQMKPVVYNKNHIDLPLPAEFAQGMICTFTLRSYEPWIRGSFAEFDCVRKCNARLAITSQGCLLKEIPIWCRFYGLKSFWNRISYRVNSLFDRKHVTKDGSTMLRKGRIFPSFRTDFSIFQRRQSLSA